MIKDQCDNCRNQNTNSCGRQTSYDGRSCNTYSRHIDLEKHKAVSPKTSCSEKQKLFQAPFSFHGRIRRLEYWLSYIITYAAAFFVGIMGGVLEETNNESLSGVLYVAFMIVFYWFAFAQNAKRCHDRGNSGWYQLIPFYGLFLLFGDGDEFENDYGPDPKGRNIYDV